MTKKYDINIEKVSHLSTNILSIIVFVIIFFFLPIQHHNLPFIERNNIMASDVEFNSLGLSMLVAGADTCWLALQYRAIKVHKAIKVVWCVLYVLALLGV